MKNLLLPIEMAGIQAQENSTAMSRKGVSGKRMFEKFNSTIEKSHLEEPSKGMCGSKALRIHPPIEQSSIVRRIEEGTIRKLKIARTLEIERKLFA